MGGYGFPTSHFYDKKRHTGTIQTYKLHQKGENPLIEVGEQDITAHVDFTHLVKSQQAAGFSLFEFSPQHRYLTNHGKPWLLALEKSFNQTAVSKLKQFQTLTSPEMMGNKFHVLETVKGFTPSSPALTLNPEQVLEL